MYQIKLMNKISPAGLEVFPADSYRCGDAVEDPDGIIVRSASLHDLDMPGSVRGIARAGVGVNNIPIDACSEKGIAVFNTPGANANAVKELTIMGLLLSARKIYPAMQWVQSLKGTDDVVKQIEAGKGKFTGPELRGKRLGIIGLGRIGVMVCNAARDLGMEVYGYDPNLSVDAALEIAQGFHKAVSLKELFEICDFITLHLPLTGETNGMINASSIAAMKHGVRLINFSRRELVDTADILAALDERHVYCYITDFPDEALLGHPGIIALPHLGASTPESEINCAEMAARQLREFLETGNVRNSVNLPDMQVRRSGLCRVTIIHKNIPNMISGITSAAAGYGVNIDNLTNKSKGVLAYTIMDLDAGVTPEILAKLNDIDGVIRVTLIR